MGELVEKEDLIQLYQIKAREVAMKRHDEKNAREKNKMSGAELREQKKREAAEKQERLMKRAQELEAQGVSWASFKAMKEMLNEEMEEAKRKKGVGKGGVEASAGALAAQLEDMDTGELPM